MIAYRHNYSLKSLIIDGIYVLLSTVGLILALRLIGVIFRKLYKTIDSLARNPHSLRANSEI